MKTIVIITILLATSFSWSFAEDVTVETVVVGVGQTREAALQDAFAMAITQLDGTYIGIIEKAGDQREDLSKNKVVTFGPGNLSQYKIVEEKVEGNLIFLTVRVTVQKQNILGKQFGAGFKADVMLGQAANLAAFDQANMKNTKRLIQTMMEPETLVSIGYQFRSAGQPVVENIGPDHTSGYLPVWIGRNSTFWLEFFDLLKAIEPQDADMTYGWYGGRYESVLWKTEGQKELPFDIDDYRLITDVGGIRVNKDIGSLLHPQTVTIQMADSTESLSLLLDRNLIIAGFDENADINTWFVKKGKSSVCPWFLAPGWIDIATNKHVLSAPPGTSLYIAPQEISDTTNFTQIYKNSSDMSGAGENLTSYRRNVYQRWGNGLGVATTGLGFVVKVPFSVKTPQILKQNANRMQFSVRKTQKHIGLSRQKPDVIFEQEI